MAFPGCLLVNRLWMKPSLVVVVVYPLFFLPPFPCSCCFIQLKERWYHSWRCFSTFFSFSMLVCFSSWLPLHEWKIVEVILLLFLVDFPPLKLSTPPCSHFILRLVRSKKCWRQSWEFCPYFVSVGLFSCHFPSFFEGTLIGASLF